MTQTVKIKNSVTATNTPTTLALGELAANLIDHKLWIGTPSGPQNWFAEKGVSIGITPPADPYPGQLWWDSTDEQSGKLYVWFDDGSSKQWVITNAAPRGARGAPGEPGATGPQGGTGPQGETGGLGAGVTDGSNAAPGEIGELLFATETIIPPVFSKTTTSYSAAALALPAGDWDVTVGTNLYIVMAVASNINGVSVNYFRHNIAGTFTSIDRHISNASGNVGLVSWVAGGNATMRADFCTGPVRINTNQVVNLSASISGTMEISTTSPVWPGDYLGGSSVVATIRARRMR